MKTATKKSGLSKVSGAAKQNSISIYKDTKMFQPFDSFRVTIYSPNELPFRAGQQYFYGRYDTASIFILTGLKTTDKELESWVPEQRNCFMEHEKN